MTRRRPTTSSLSPLMPMVRPRLRPGQGAIASNKQFSCKEDRGSLWKTCPGPVGPCKDDARTLQRQESRAATMSPWPSSSATSSQTTLRRSGVWIRHVSRRGSAYSKEELKSYVRLPEEPSRWLPPTPRMTSIAGFIVVQQGLVGHVITIDVSPAGPPVGSGVVAAAGGGRIACGRQDLAL